MVWFLIAVIICLWVMGAIVYDLMVVAEDEIDDTDFQSGWTHALAVMFWPIVSVFACWMVLVSLVKARLARRRAKRRWNHPSMADTFKYSLQRDDYVPNFDDVDDAVTEVSGEGYTKGGKDGE